jgi:hypothetical protein
LNTISLIDFILEITPFELSTPIFISSSQTTALGGIKKPKLLPELFNSDSEQYTYTSLIK